MKYVKFSCRNYFNIADFASASYEEKGLWFEAFMFSSSYDMNGVIFDYRVVLETDCFIKIKEFGESVLWSFEGEHTIILHYYDHTQEQKYLFRHYKLQGDFAIIGSFHDHLLTTRANNMRVYPPRIYRPKKTGLSHNKQLGMAGAIRAAKNKSS